MLAQNVTIYALPGWGFHASIFDALQHDAFCLKGLDYIHLAELPPQRIAEELSDQLPDDACLLGWSLGGLLAMQIASLFPHKIKKLILIASQPKLELANAEAFFHAAVTDLEQQLAYFLRLVCYPHRSRALRAILQQHMVTGQTRALISLLALLFSLDLRSQYQHLDQDILQIISQQDAVVSQRADLPHPKATIITLEQAGHAGFLTHTSLCVDAITRWLRHE